MTYSLAIIVVDNIAYRVAKPGWLRIELGSKLEDLFLVLSFGIATIANDINEYYCYGKRL